MQIGVSPEDWEEAGSSAEAKLITEMDRWLWIEMGPYAGMEEWQHINAKY